MPVKDWYSIQAKKQGDETIAEVRIYDEIGFWGVTAKTFVEQLDTAAAGASRILVSINSPGGSVFDAFAIYNALRRHDLPVTTRVDGVAASAASLIFMAGDERVMPENAMLMIHNMWIVVAGTADELRNTADMMDKARSGAVAAYGRSGQSEDEIIRMLDETTWMDALEAQSLGFSTMMEEPVRIAASANSTTLLELLPGVSAELLSRVNASKEPDGDPGAASTNPTTSDPAPDDTAPAQATKSGSAAMSSADLVKHVYSTCRTQKIPHLAESVLVSCSLTDQASVDARLEEAAQIAGLCVAAKLQDRAAEFVTAGLNTEQVRARLFDQVVNAAESISISNTQRPPTPQSSPRALRGPNPMAIYAARKTSLAR